MNLHNAFEVEHCTDVATYMGAVLQFDSELHYHAWLATTVEGMIKNRHKNQYWSRQADVLRGNCLA